MSERGDLAPADLSGRILGCDDGPASFNCEATSRGIRVTSCDPIYAFAKEEIQQRVVACRAEIRRVPYEFQRGGNEMLVIRKAD